MGTKLFAHQIKPGYLESISDDKHPTLDAAVTYDINVNASTVIEWGKGQVQQRTPAGNETLSYVAPSKPGHFTLLIIQDSEPKTVAHPASVKWLTDDGDPPDISVANKTHVITMLYDGFNYAAAYLGYY